MAYKEAVKESLYLNLFIKEISSIIPIFNNTKIIKTDSQSAIELAKNPIYHARTKHVDIRYYFVREKCKGLRLGLVATLKEHSPRDNKIVFDSELGF